MFRLLFARLLLRSIIILEWAATGLLWLARFLGVTIHGIVRKYAERLIEGVKV